MLRVVLDTNVLVSGLLFGGIPHSIIQAALAERLEWLTSPHLLAELERVLETKFPHRWETIQDTLEVLRSVATVIINPTEAISAISEDPADNRVLECAVSGRADMIVSGDRHLLVLKAFRGIAILTPQEFFAHFKG